MSVVYGIELTRSFLERRVLATNWGPLSRLLDWSVGHRVSPLVERINPLVPLKLNWDVLIQELVDLEPAAANLDEDLRSLNFDLDSAGTKLIDALLHAQEHDLELSAVRIVIDVLG